jgi:hypothetical protein
MDGDMKTETISFIKIQVLWALYFLGMLSMAYLIRMIEIIKILMLQFIFTGNGVILVGRKCPDFVHKTKKIAVDVFYRRHKEDFRGGLQKWKVRRRAYFARRGWKLIFLDETMVNEEYISKKLKNL